MTTNEMIDCDILHDWSIIEDRSIVDGPATLLTEVQRMKAELERSRAPQKA